MKTTADRINDRGEIIGTYRDSSFAEHGFLYDNGTFTILDAPGASFTTVSAINNLGEVVGYYVDNGGAPN